jgi:hypothetical protein
MEEARRQGITLYKLDDHILELCLKGKPVALFNQGKVELKADGQHHMGQIYQN